ncbi:MAG: oleate hydratase [Bifidobacteriaceae bacterium]|jgi:oleate hydratase|nr:oleate hydratase [Bifidobacteriaceae bacterium]
MSIPVDSKQAYFVGGGIGSLAGAAFLIRDCGWDGRAIHVLESLSVLGGSNDGIGTPDVGFVTRGGRMLNEETFENFWDLFRTIPSLRSPGLSVTEEILEFDHAHPTRARARLVDRDGRIEDVRSMGFTQGQRIKLLRLMLAKESKLDNLTIADWFGPDFFTTAFWHMWQTTFAFQTWSSVFELRRYMWRMIFEFSRIETLEGVTRSPLDQYDSLIVPLVAWLKDKGVVFRVNTTVTDLRLAPGPAITVTGIETESEDGVGFIELADGDLCFVTNGCITDGAALGDLDTPPDFQRKPPNSGALWAKLAAKKPVLGNPEPFFSDPDKSNWYSFTATFRGSRFIDMITRFTGNVPGSGALMTFKDSGWKLSTVVAAQPHFAAQGPDQTVMWGYGLYTDAIGDYVRKPMRDCTGREVLTELIHQLHFGDQLEAIMADVVNVIPAMMPYIDSEFMPRAMADRPPVVAPGSTNLAMVSQFVEIPEDMVFTEEYSVRAARIAAYALTGTPGQVAPVTPHAKRPATLLRALHTSYRRGSGAPAVAPRVAAGAAGAAGATAAVLAARAVRRRGK